MIFHFYTRLVLPAFIAPLILAVSALSLQADDFLNRASAEYYDKNFGAAYTLAGKSSDLTQRAFVHGMAALRLEKYEEAVTLLGEAGQKLPLIADYALFFQAEALQKLKQYPAASTKAASIRISFPSSKLLRRSEKLLADIQYDSGDYKIAQKSYQSFIEKYSSGTDSIDASYQLARCLEELVNYDGALQIYRSIWLNTPTSPLAAKSQERIKFLDRLSFKAAPYTPEELLKRAATLQAQNQHNDSLKALEMIQTASVSQEMADRIAFRTGKAQYLLKRYAQAEKQFIKAAASTIPGIRSEGRFWLAKSLDRQDLKVQAFAMYMELAGEGKKQEYADDALIEAAELKRGLGQFAEAARLFDQVAKVTLESKTIAKSVWNGGWCRYLAGDYPAATEAFKNLLSDEKYREKALYWIGRGVEKGGDTASAASYFRTLTNEFPAGFYATWYREQKGVKDGRESIGNRDPLVEIPTAAGFDKPRLLASLGLIEEARVEMAAIRKKNGEKKGQFPGVARIYLEMRDYGMAIYMFIQNKPLAWTKETLPLWTFGYPRAFSQLISQNSSLNGLSEGLVYALIRAESGFSPAIKSGAGAIGLMQMMPATARMTAHEKGEFNPQRLTTPEYNIRLGTRHLHDLMKEYDGDVVYMAAAYNAGSGALGRWKKSYKGLQKDEFIESIPYQETREYVKKVYASAATYRQLYGIK